MLGISGDAAAEGSVVKAVYGLREAKDMSENAAWGEGLMVKAVYGFEAGEGYK